MMWMESVVYFVTGEIVNLLGRHKNVAGSPLSLFVFVKSSVCR
jgi:hypothetical protein